MMISRTKLPARIKCMPSSCSPIRKATCTWASNHNPVNTHASLPMSEGMHNHRDITKSKRTKCTSSSATPGSSMPTRDTCVNLEHLYMDGWMIKDTGISPTTPTFIIFRLQYFVKRSLSLLFSCVEDMYFTSEVQRIHNLTVKSWVVISKLKTFVTKENTKSHVRDRTFIFSSDSWRLSLSTKSRVFTYCSMSSKKGCLGWRPRFKLCNAFTQSLGVDSLHAVGIYGGVSANVCTRFMSEKGWCTAWTLWTLVWNGKGMMHSLNTLNLRRSDTCTKLARAHTPFEQRSWVCITCWDMVWLERI